MKGFFFFLFHFTGIICQTSRLLSLLKKFFFNFYKFNNVIGPFNFSGTVCVKDSVVTGNILQSSFIMDHVKCVLITSYENQYVLC